MDKIQEMLDLQWALQKELSEKVPGNKDPKELKTLGEIYTYLRDNKIALDDEFREVIDALPGMGIDIKARSGLWKSWKANHADLSAMEFSELSPDDMANLKEEFIDLFHFVLNMMLALGISSDDLFCIYCRKHDINSQRYNSKY